MCNSNNDKCYIPQFHTWHATVFEVILHEHFRDFININLGHNNYYMYSG